jgi:hypothetical protein
MVMRPRFLALLISVVLVFFIVDLVRRRKLREEYSWLWISLSAFMVVLAIWPGLLRFITDLIGAAVLTSTLFFFALVFLVFINIQFSVEISTLRKQVKNLAQKLAILEEEGGEGGEAEKKVILDD